MVPPALSISGLARATLMQLRTLAQKLGVPSYSGLSKQSLIEELGKVIPASEEVSIAATAVPAPEAPASISEAQVAAVSTQVTFLPRDPQWAYVFWEIAAADRARAEAAGAQQLCLRVADVTGLPLGVSHPHTLQELVVDANGNEWFLPVPLSDRDYRVELGYRLAGGGWLSLAMSSVARVPALGPSDVIADVFVPFTLDGPVGAVQEAVGGAGVEHERLYRMATLASPRSRRVGSEVFQEFEQSLEQRGLLHDSGAGLWASGRSESGSGLVRPRSFWLVADAELIVYGATEPSATLYIGEEQVPLAADGTFRVQIPFRDGEPLYPIRAVAADGEQERSIRLEFQRRTPEARVNSREEAVLEWF
jgi:hypothetical protein